MFSEGGQVRLLNEDSRSSLISQGRRGEKEKGSGKSRYEMRVNSKVSSVVREFNDLDTESLFRYDILNINVPVRGETDNYMVRIKVSGFLEELRGQIMRNNDILDLRAISRALSNIINSKDVYVSCSCADWKYRMGYWSTMKNINSGVPERRPSKITNPRNNKGPGCKHVMLVLSNISWAIKLASVINNYIIYMQRNRKRQYADVIYPAIYGKAYEEPVQLDIDSEDTIANDKETIDIANQQGRTRGQFTTGNPYRFQSNNNVDRNQISIEDTENTNN